MRLIFVRHGEPDYAHDCLTETGKKQALAAAERLTEENIDAIYASPFGRALETAQATADRLGLPVTVLDYMHEITWGGKQAQLPENGHPWFLSWRMIEEEDFDFYRADWREHPSFRDNRARDEFDRVSAAFDGFMAAQGYIHDGGRFLCEQSNEKALAIFSHGGSGGIVLSHLLHLPFPYVCAVMPYDFTSIIILDFPSEPGRYVFPRLELFNDCAHIRRGPSRPVLQEKADPEA